MSIQPNITLNANFMSNFSNFQNGLVLGQVNIINDGCGSRRFVCDTSTAGGVSMLIPDSNQFLTISFVSPDNLAIIGTTNPLITNYLLTLYFDVDDDTLSLMDKPENNLPR
jgi:hypothetical protein